KWTKPESGSSGYYSFWQYIHIDIPLLFSILLLITFGLIILYSASSQNILVVEQQLMRIGLSLAVLFVFAKIPPAAYRRWAFLIYVTGIILLFLVLIAGHVGKGAGRWLSMGFLRFQPSEIMKLAIPMFLA